MSLPVKTTTVNTTVKEKNPGNVIAEKWQYSVLLGFIYIVLAGESAASLHAESTQTQISFGYSYVYNSRMEKLINCFKKKPDAVVRLICFPWAGGGSIHYARWGSVLNSSIEVFAVKLPGRESRAKEPFFENMQQIVDEVLNLLLPVLKEKPFALFGHSFGAFTSYAVADALKKLENIEPVHIFLSGASAPYSETRIQAPKRSDLSDEDFLKWLISIGGTPPELLANPEVLKVFLPALKADLHVVENYKCNKPVSAFLSCPVSCFDGKDDIPHDLQAWKAITTGDFNVRMLDGSHFYLKDLGNERIILDYVTRQLELSGMDYF